MIIIYRLYFIIFLELEPPLHEFHIRKVEVKTGKNKGNSKVTNSLIIPPWVFTTRRRAKEVGDTIYFSCNFCRNDGGREAMAQAIRLEDDEDGIPNFSLSVWPRDANAHSCNRPPTSHLVKEFREMCYAQVKKDPTKALLTICKENRGYIANRENLDEDQKKAFLPICLILTRFLHHFIDTDQTLFLELQNHL